MLSVAVALGALLLAGQVPRAGVLHGTLGAAGTVAACVAVWDGRLPGSFSGAILGLLVAALCAGVLLWRGARAGLVVFLHVMAGGVAYLLLVGAVLS